MNSIVYSKTHKKLLECPFDFGMDNPVLTIPEGVTQIQHQAFSGNLYLEEIILPETMKQIGTYAFSQCSRLKRIRIPSGVTKISKCQFSVCPKLETVILPETLEKIGASAFAGCTGLQSITLPDGLHYVQNSSFDHCENLQEIVYKGLKIHINFKNWSEVSYLNQTIQFVQERDFQMPIISHVKYDLIWQMFQQTPDDKELRDFIKRNFSALFLFLIQENKTDIIQKIIQDGQYLTKNNIQKFILYANQHQHYEAQVLLMNFQNQNGFYKQKNLFL